MRAEALSFSAAAEGGCVRENRIFGGRVPASARDTR